MADTKSEHPSYLRDLLGQPLNDWRFVNVYAVLDTERRNNAHVVADGKRRAVILLSKEDAERAQKALPLNMWKLTRVEEYRALVHERDGIAFMIDHPLKNDAPLRILTTSDQLAHILADVGSISI